MTEGQKRIGFVDDNLENFHSNVYLKLLRNELKHRGFVVAGCTGLRPRAGRKWAEVNGVPWFSDAAGLNEAVDCFMRTCAFDPGDARRVVPTGISFR